MKAVTTFHKPSSVSSSVKCRLIHGSDLEFLVVAKLDRLEVFSLQPEGLVLECELEILGRLLAVKAVPVEGSRHDNLVVLTDHPDPEIILFSYILGADGVRELKTDHYLSLFERSGRAAEFFTNVILDPSGNIVVISCYVGKLKVIVLDNGAYKSDFDVSIPELNLLALTFLAPGDESDELCLALLHVDHQQRLQLLARDLDVQNEQLSPKPSTLLPSIPLPMKSFPVTSEALPILVAVPPLLEQPTASTGGILILGGKKVLYYDLAPPSAQDKAKGKQGRSEKKKKAAEKSGDAAEAEKARQKEEERMWKKKKSRSWIEWPWSSVETYCTIFDGRYVIGDAFGKLAMISVDSSEERKLTLVALGETAPATTLCYLTSQIMYLGSHFGDSQILRINPSAVSALESPTLPVPPDITTISPAQLTASVTSAKGKGKERAMEVDTDDEGRKQKEGRGVIVVGTGSYLSSVQTFKNIAPIMDAALVNMDKSGQHQIVTCSGGRNTGSLNVVRNGADFQALAVAEGLANVTNMWPLRALYEDTKDTHLLVSTLCGSHLFRFEGASRISGISASATEFITTEPTLAIKNIAERRVTTDARGLPVSSYVDGSLVVQVTKSGVRMFEYDMTLGIYSKVGEEWNPSHEYFKWGDREIVAASLNASQFVVGLSGGKLVLMNATGTSFNVLKSIDAPGTPYNEISAVTCTPINTENKFTNCVAVSFWGINKVGIYSATNLSEICMSPELSALPRSLLLYNFGPDPSVNSVGYHSHLLVGLADGIAVSFTFKKNTLGDKKVFSLGDLPVFLSTCKVESRNTVFACGSRASILFWERDILKHSPVILKDVVAASWLNTSRLSSCLALATSSGLLIGKIKDIDKMHIRSISTGLDLPRRIVYHSSLNMYGIVSIRTEPARIGAAESMSSSFKVLDDVTFHPSARYECGAEEEMTAIHALAAPLPCFAIGTCRYKPGETDPTDGQLLIFSMHTSGATHIKPVVSAEVHGCIFAMATITDMLAVAVNSSVVIYRLALREEGTSQALSLHKVAEWNHNYFVISLVSRGHTLMLGDAISSISFLELQGSHLKVLARDYGSLWPVCVEARSEKCIIGANSDHNLFTFTLEHSELETMLKRDGSFYIGDMVNKFVTGALASSDISDDHVLEAKQLFFTASGRIGVIVDMDRQTSIHMTELQRNMAAVIPLAGGLTHTVFRAPRNRRGRSDAEASSVGFLDGDFLERFLAILPTSTILGKIMEGTSPAEALTLPQESIHKILERLRGLH